MERLQSGGDDAVDALQVNELEAILDDLPLALESDDIRSSLPRIMRRVDEARAWRAFRRLIEIARQDPERKPLLLSALREVRWNGRPGSDDLAWLMEEMAVHPTPAVRADAFERIITLDLDPAQANMLESAVARHPDDEVRRGFEVRRGRAARAAGAAPEPSSGAPSEGGTVDYQEEKPAERMTVRTLLRSLEPAQSISPASTEAPPPSREPEDPTVTPMTVRTLLRSLETVKVKLEDASPEAAESLASPGDPPAGETREPAAEGSAASATTVSTLLRSLDTARVSLEDLAQAGGDPVAVPMWEVPSGTARSASRWADLDLPSLSLQDRSRKLARVRRELAPRDRRAWLDFLLRNEGDPVIGPSLRKELLEFAFDRPLFSSFDRATQARLGRWIRERSVSDAIPAVAVLAALRRAVWVDGEPPRFDEAVRPIVEAATGSLARAPSEERITLLGRDFSIWLFAVREFEDYECLHSWAADKTPGVAEGLFRALAAMDALAARVGGTGGGPTALDLTLGMWDKADIDSRLEMAHAIAAGWSRGLVHDRVRFFSAFWKRHQENESQRESVLIALASFETELEEERQKSAPPAPHFGGRKAPLDPLPPGLAPATLTPPSSPFSGEDEEDETSSRYLTRRREQLERAMQFSRNVMRASPAPTDSPPPSTPADPEASSPQAPSEADTEPRLGAAPVTDTDEEMAVPDEGEVFEEGGVEDEPSISVDPDPPKATEGGAPLPGAREVTPLPDRPLPPVGRAVAAPSPQRSEQTPASPDDDVVLPGEPLRTLADYTGFLRSLSSGGSIDDLLEKHGMDYRQYAACMTAWQRLLQSRPDLALRMGQLLKH